MSTKHHYKQELSTIKSIAKQMARKFYYDDVDEFVSIGHEVMAKQLTVHDNSKSALNSRIYSKMQYAIIDYLRHIGYIDNRKSKGGFRNVPLLDVHKSIVVENNNELSEKLRKSIMCLGNKQRFAVYHYYYNNMKLHEIGKMMGISESLTCRILKKGIEELRRYLC